MKYHHHKLLRILDCHLKVDKYFNATCKSSSFRIKNIGRIRNCLSDESAEIVIHAFIRIYLIIVIRYLMVHLNLMVHQILCPPKIHRE